MTNGIDDQTVSAIIAIAPTAESCRYAKFPVTGYSVHFSDVIMSMMASQITSPTIVRSTV